GMCGHNSFATIRISASELPRNFLRSKVTSTACLSIGHAEPSFAAQAAGGPMLLVIDRSGTVRCIYDETIPLPALGTVSIQRGSFVEPTADGQWFADLSPVRGPMLGPFDFRSDALAAELDWLERNWLVPADCQ